MHLRHFIIRLIQFILYLNTTRGILRYNENNNRAPSFLMEPGYKVEFSNNTGGWIDCTADGYPSPRIEWTTTDGAYIIDIPGLRQTLRNGTLIFSPFHPSAYRQDVHSSIYRCMATNPVGSIISRDVQVRAIVKQSYKVVATPLNAARGCTAVLQCVIPMFVKDFVKVVSWIQEPSLYIYPTLQGDGKYHALQTGELLIHNVDYEESYHVYRCHTVHRITKEVVVSSPVTIRLSENRGVSSPAIIGHTSTVQVPQHEGAILICISQGCPQPDYRWYQVHHGSEAVFVLPGPRTRVLGPVLAIEAVAADDTGIYKCTASNSGGEASAEVQLLVTTPLSVEVTPAVQIANIGGTAEFRCVVPSYHGAGLHLISWFKDGRPFPGRSSGDTLLVTSIGREDKGMYQCFVRRAEGESAQGSAELQLGDAAPSLIYTFIEQTLQPGPALSLKCTATGNPTPTFKWKLDGFPLPENERFHVGNHVTLQGDAISYVNISHISVEDGGEYSCIAENRAGKISHEARLNIYGLPYIRTIPKITAIAGESLIVKCPVSGYPIEQITWEKDRKELPLNIRQKIVNGVLNIDPVEKLADSGSYTCTVRNKQGQSARRTGEIYVIVPPKLNSIAPHRVLNVGERASLTCSVIKGDLPITISWSKDSQPILSKQQATVTQVDQYNSLLVIENITPQHSGNYTCLARNPVAQEIITQQLMVNVPPSIEPFYFPTDGLQEGTRTRVVCGISRGDPPLSITWLKDGAPISSKLGVNISTLDPYSSLLSISSLSSLHSGEYTCVAANPAAQVMYSSKLQVKVPPRWVVEPSDVNAERNKHATIDCQANGVPQPTLLWKKAIGDKSGEYGEIREGSSIRLLSNGSLLLQNVKENMEGFYLCQASNGIGNAIGKVVQLKVRSAPFFSGPTKPVSVKKGDTAVLQCNVNGDQPITIKWIRNGKLELSSATNYRVTLRQDITSTGVLGEMQIIGAESNDAGAYFCQASNSYGKDQQLVNVYVQEPPESPTELKAVMVDSQAVNIQWQHHSSREGEVTKFIVQHKRPNGEWIETEVNSDLRGALIEGLRPATRYTIRVLAEGTAGPSKPSVAINVKTDPQKPSGPPVDVQIKAISSTELVVNWSPPHPDLRNGDIQGYIIGYRDETSSPSIYNISKVTGIGDGYEEVVLQNLMKYTRYMVTVQAFNQLGPGPMSDPVVAQTLEDVPSMPPTKISCTAMGSQTLQISWNPPLPQHSNGIIQGYKVQYDSLSQGIDDYGVVDVTGSSTVLNNLRKFTNYTIQVLAYTLVGDGVYSNAIYCNTEEDAPGTPDDIKAMVSTPQSLLISWLPPSEPNGIIIRYNLYIRMMRGNEELNHEKRAKQGTSTSYELKGLQQQHVEYQFWVTAITRVGEGQSSKVISLHPTHTIAAKISSFGTTVLTPQRSSITLECKVVGSPSPRIKWMKNDYQLTSTRAIQLKDNGDLFISSIQRSDFNNYTCIAQNKFGSDSITYQLIVQGSPGAPLLYISSSTSNSILLHWKMTDTGYSSITQFVLTYKKASEEQQQVTIFRRAISYELKGLACGSIYQLNMISQNKYGSSKTSNTLTVRTQGQKPGVPQRSTFISLNSTSVLLNLYEWPSNGCPILSFNIKYRQQNDVDWIIVSDTMKPQRKALITGLMPATEYHVQVEGHNAAGYSAGDFYFFTLTKDGEMPPPESVKRGELSRPFYMRSEVVIPVILFVMLVILLSVTTLIICQKLKRKQVKREESMDNERNLRSQRDRFYATLQKVSQESSSDKIPETASDISPYATFQLGDANSTLMHDMMAMRQHDYMQGSATPQSTISKTRRHRRSSRRTERADTEESDSEGEYHPGGRVDLSNQLEGTKGKQGYIYHAANSSTSSDISLRSDHKSISRGPRSRLFQIGKSRTPTVAETAFNGGEQEMDSIKKIKLASRSSLWTRPGGSQQHGDYSIAV